MKTFVLAALALLPGCTQAKGPSPARPALWKAYDADTTIYLFGGRVDDAEDRAGHRGL